ncbi:MAG: hypothetical protein KF690_05330 [Bacteroidetes bacterium]|nr:hypothetical protein [Bacteroidota bacterium]
MRQRPLFLQKYPLVWGGLFLLLLAAGGCQKPLTFKESGNIGFSADSVRFDTLFTGQLSPSRRLYLYNRSGHALRIRSLSIGGGEGSDFRLIADGVQAQAHQDLELASGDSLYLFFSIRKTVNQNTDVTDVLRVETEGRVDEVVLHAHILHAYLIRDSIMDCNTLLPTDKPVVVDGILRVDEGCTLTIPAGARLYFTARQNNRFDFESQVQVLGRLLVEGTAANPVLFSSFRLGSTFGMPWQEEAGQWGGLHFTQFSQGSVIRHALIRNASIGVQVDSISLAPPEPKLTLDRVELRNFSNFAILGLGAAPAVPGGAPNILASNVLAYNAGQSVVGLYFGGSYQFTNCTFADFNQVSNSGNQPAVAISNYLAFQNENGANQAFDYPTEAVFQNCIIWGSQENEFATDFRNYGGASPVLGFFHTLLKAQVFDTGNTTNFFNQDPFFRDIFNRDYRLQSISPAIGKANATLSPPQDLRDTPRDAQPDLGALEFVPD